MFGIYMVMFQHHGVAKYMGVLVAQRCGATTATTRILAALLSSALSYLVDHLTFEVGLLRSFLGEKRWKRWERYGRIWVSL